MDDLKYQLDLMKALNEKLMSSEHIYRSVAEFSGNVFIYMDFKNEITQLIGPWDEMLGHKVSRYSFDEDYFKSLILEEDQDLFKEQILDMDTRKETYAHVEIRTKMSKKWLDIEAKVNYSVDGECLEKIICGKEITKDKAKSEELTYLAYYDSLTGLYNRNYFVTLLRDLCDRAEVFHENVELLFLDIDDFKRINDSLGLLYGDELVQDFGLYLKEFQNDNVIVGRFGSDVFCLAIYSPCGQRSADAIYQSVCEHLRKPFVLTNKSELTFSVSAGVAEFPEAGRSALEIIKNAEIVLYKAKAKGKNKIQYFNRDILDSFVKSISLEEELKETIEKSGFVLYYQPIYEVATEKLVGAEALIRWPDEKGNFSIGPKEFIPIAEKNGTIVPIGDWVLEEAVRTMNDWQEKYHYPMTLSINISSVQLEKDNFIDKLAQLIERYEADAASFILEFDEQVFFDENYLMTDKINTLRRLGVQISVDDYGTGYSSITKLKEIPIDILKLDQSLVDFSVKDPATGIIIESIITLAKKLKIKTVAEGVETRTQFDFIKKTECDEAQGFLFSRAVSRADFEKIIIRQLP